MNNKTKQYTFDDLRHDINCIKSQLTKSEYTPEVIVGLSRGGLVPAVVLSHQLKIPMVSMNWSLRDGDHTDDLTDFINGKRVLVVDDIIDSGNSISTLISDSSLNARAGDFKIAALVYNIAQDVRADYYGRIIDRRYNQEWFTFWWEAIDQFTPF